MLVTASWQARICTWRTLYLASIQHSVSLQNKYDLCSHKDGARNAMNRSRQDLKFYYTTHSLWKLHSLCTHALNVKYFKLSDALIILQHSRLKSSFRGPRVCLVDCDPLSIFPGATLVCPGDTESRTRPDLQQSANKPLSSVAPWMMCADRNLAGAAICFQYVPERKI